MRYFSLFFLFLLSLQPLSAQSQIQHIEPPNWWTGMIHNEVQVMVHGEKIAELRPKVNYRGVTLTQITSSENPNYQFLTLSIAEDAEAGEVQIDWYKIDKKVLVYQYPLLEREPIPIDGFSAADAIYLITPDRFVNGNPQNDDVAGMREPANRANKGSRHGGDIAGIHQSLDYIQSMGFTAIWLNPLLENDMAEYSYHGYSTTDFYRVDPRFGSNEEYRALADEARSKGLKLIMDMIVNHCGSFHWWMEDLPADDWLNQWENYTETNHRKTALQDPYVSQADKKAFTDGWFVPTMPDLNQRNPLLATYLIQNSIWWVEYLKLSGIRMDTYPYPDMDFMADWAAAMMKEYPTLNIVGEEWSLNPAIVAYWQKGKINPNGYTSELKSVMDFPGQRAMAEALADEESWDKGLIKLYDMIAQDFLYADPMNLVTFPDNHDMPRFYAQVGEDLDLFKMGVAFVLTMRGIPQVYYGTEVLMSSPTHRDDGIIRSDFPGGWEGDAVNTFTGKGLTVNQKEAKAYLQQLLSWRKTATVLHTGKLMHFIPRDGVYVYFRYTDSEKVMVILNKNEGETELKLARFSEMLMGKKEGKDVVTGKTHLLQNSLTVTGKTATILILK